MRKSLVSLLAGTLAVASVAFAHPAAAARGWLGVYTQEITPELRDGMNYNGNGALVRRVVSDSPADRAGVERGDVIVRVGTRAIESPDDLVDAVRQSGTGTPMDVTVVRDGAKKSLRVTLSSQRESPEPDGADDSDVPTPAPSPRMGHRAPIEPIAPMAPMPPDSPRGRVRAFTNHPGDDDGEDHDMILQMPDMMGSGLMGRGRLGVRIESLNPDLASYFGSRDAKGALVLDVTEDSPARKAGIRAGDVITRVDSKMVESSEDLVEAVRSADDNVTISLLRHGAKQAVEAALDRAPEIMRFQGGPGAFSWKSGDGRTRRMQGQGGRNGVRRIIIDGDVNDGDDTTPPRGMDPGRESMDSMREELRQLRNELRQLRDEMHKDDNR